MQQKTSQCICTFFLQRLKFEEWTNLDWKNCMHRVGNLQSSPVSLPWLPLPFFNAIKIWLQRPSTGPFHSPQQTHSSKHTLCFKVCFMNTSHPPQNLIEEWEVYGDIYVRAAQYTFFLFSETEIDVLPSFQSTLLSCWIEEVYHSWG